MDAKGGIKVDIVADSIAADSHDRITTFQLRYPRFIHAEFMTHRVFSRNASSSRAIPVKTLLDQIRNDPAMPIHWGKNQAGMQAREELNVTEQAYAEKHWKMARDSACDHAAVMDSMGVHKQIVNRIAEPFQFINVVATTTEFENFFMLRRHPDAQPEFHELADAMWDAMQYSMADFLEPGQWHMPYVMDEEQADLGTAVCLKLSTARCARVSYLNHDKTNPNVEKDMMLHDMLLKSQHLSPFEHQATPMVIPKWNPLDIQVDAPIRGVTHYDRWGQAWSGNFRGYIQHRQYIGE